MKINNLNCNITSMGINKKINNIGKMHEHVKEFYSNKINEHEFLTQITTDVSSIYKQPSELKNLTDKEKHFIHDIYTTIDLYPDGTITKDYLMECVKILYEKI